jgi:hypothetical protein
MELMHSRGEMTDGKSSGRDPKKMKGDSGF